MAGRGTDIMLEENSEYLAKQEMKKLKYSDEEIEEANSSQRNRQQKNCSKSKIRRLEKKYADEIKEEKKKLLKPVD